MKRPRQDTRDEKEQIQFEQDLYRALRLEGLLLPETEGEVRAAEADDLCEAPPLALRDPRTVLKRVRSKPHQTSSAGPAASPEIEDNLARAAREGGKIPPEVEREMQRDREAAERKKYGNEG